MCRLRRIWPLALGLAAVVVSSSPVADIASAQSPTGVPPPFQSPSDEAIASSPRRVYAHYFPLYPISIDNEDAAVDYYSKGFLAPDGENGKHAEYGGLLRQRPLPRAVDPSAEWALDDMKTEVTRAVDAGISGFTVDVLSLDGPLWHRVELLLDAAAIVEPEFDIVLMPDANTRVVADAAVLADALAAIADHPALARLDDGRLVVSPFLPERVGAEWWATWMSMMRDRGVEVAFVPVFLDYTRSIESFADLSYGVSAWGGRSPESIEKLEGQAADAHDRGLLWMQPVALQDTRPKSGTFDEANNTETLRTMWDQASTSGAEWVQMITWNDYSEQSEFAPSTHTGWSPLDISAYYIARFITGVDPVLVSDQLFVSHRIHAVAALPTGPQTKLMSLREGSSPARDTVEVLSFLRLGATVDVVVGDVTYSYEAPPGVHAEVFPLATGSIGATSVAADGFRASVTSPFPVVAAPVVQDLQYHFASSARQGETMPPTTLPPPSTAVAQGEPAEITDVEGAEQPDAGPVATDAADDGGLATWLGVGVLVATGLAAVAIVRRRTVRRDAANPAPPPESDLVR